MPGSAPATGWWWRPTRCDGTFLKLPADVAIVTNVDPEHLDHFKTFDAVQDAFRDFRRERAVLRLRGDVHRPSGGAGAGRPIEDRRVITYGENPQADVRLIDLDHDRRRARASRSCSATATAETVHAIDDLTLPMPGHHNALNATAAIAVAHELGISDDAIRKALAGFGGVQAPLHPTGEWNGVTIIDDYGHHPVEIAAVLKAARESDQGPGDRRGAAASLHAAAIAVRASSAPASTTPTR